MLDIGSVVMIKRIDEFDFEGGLHIHAIGKVVSKPSHDMIEIMVKGVSHWVYKNQVKILEGLK